MERGGQGDRGIRGGLREDGGGSILTGTFLLGVRCPSDLEEDATTHTALLTVCLWDWRFYSGMPLTVKQVADCAGELSRGQTDIQPLPPSPWGRIHPVEGVTLSDSCQDLIWARG